MPHLDHVAVTVADLARSVAFYEGLGFRPADAAGEEAAFGIGDDPTPRLLLRARPDEERGRPGAGALHHAAFTVPTREALLRWKRHLADRGVRVRGPFPRLSFHSIYFDDPDGATIELATRERNPDVRLQADPETGLVHPPAAFTAGGRDEAAIEAERWPEPVPAVEDDMRIEGLHHVSALTTQLERVSTLMTEGLGLSLVLRTVNHDATSMPHYFFGDAAGSLGTLVTYFGNPPRGRLKPAVPGTGTWHRLALAVPDEPALAACEDHLAALGHAPAMSQEDGRPLLRLSDPDGLRLELVLAAGRP